MNVLFISAFCVLFALANFFEFLVFNEEILLTFCFLSFLAFFYHFIRETVQNGLDSQFESIKQTYFEAISSRYDFIMSHFLNLSFYLSNLVAVLKVYETLNVLGWSCVFDWFSNEEVVLTDTDSFVKSLDPEWATYDSFLSWLKFSFVFNRILLSSSELNYYSKRTIVFPKAQTNSTLKVSCLSI